MIKLILHMNNYSITEAITPYQTYPQCTKHTKHWYYIHFKEEWLFFNLKNNYSNVISNPCNKYATKWSNWYYTWIIIPLQKLLQITEVITAYQTYPQCIKSFSFSFLILFLKFLALNSGVGRGQKLCDWKETNKGNNHGSWIRT